MGVNINANCVCWFNVLVTCNQKLGESLLDREPRGTTPQPYTREYNLLNIPLLGIQCNTFTLNYNEILVY